MNKLSGIKRNQGIIKLKKQITVRIVPAKHAWWILKLTGLKKAELMQNAKL